MCWGCGESGARPDIHVRRAIALSREKRWGPGGTVTLPPWCHRVLRTHSHPGRREKGDQRAMERNPGNTSLRVRRGGPQSEMAKMVQKKNHTKRTVLQKLCQWILVQPFLREPLVVGWCLFIWKLHQELINSGEGSTADSLYSPEIIYVNSTVSRSYKQKNPLHSIPIGLALRIFCMLVFFILLKV